MIDVRTFDSLGHADHGWLDARHHFSFAGYHDPARMGWGALRVWNDDKIAAKSGFPPHPHRDMEIITYVRSGAITHRDSMGNLGRTEAGDVQVMSAGTGVTHSEFNLEDDDTRIFQIWIMPDRVGGEPGWGQRAFPKADRTGRFVTLASGMAGDDTLPIRANARVSGATVTAGETLAYDLAAGRHAYLVPAKGQVRVNGSVLNERDGAAIRDVDVITIDALDDAELVLVDSL
ncbi:MAG: pirin family protein [Sphingopyxis sp.]|nr:pirin family protein [Sphingopyxis sp.]